MKKRVLRLMEGIILTALVAAAAFATYSFHAYNNYRLTAEASTVIAPHTRARAMLAQLHGEHVLPPSWAILLPVIARQQYHAFKAGEYDFAAGMSPRDVLEKIARGEVVIHKLTIPEGFTAAQVSAMLNAEPLLTGTTPLISEGAVFPNTYLFTRGEDRAELVSDMGKPMRVLLDKEWAARAPNLPLKDEAQALVLASIVEKETGVPAERPLVAAVYLNRLGKGMKLQADPTVAYGVDPSGLLKHPLTSADLARDTPFNTYTREGLPPTPICNPGAAAIDAALHPAQSDALYFVATGTGGHNFAATEAEHLKNVARYRAAIGEVPLPKKAAPAPAKKKRKTARKRA